MRRTTKTLGFAAVIAAAALAGAACGEPAEAAPASHCQNLTQTHGNSYGILNGLSLGIPVAADLDLTGNALALLGGHALAGGGDRTDTVTCTY